jgi:hypothetical protein
MIDGGLFRHNLVTREILVTVLKLIPKTLQIETYR